MSKTASSKSVVVIGGTGGIGHAVAQFYADKGCEVVITGRDQERTDAVAKEIGGKTRGIALDISEPESIEGALASLGHVDHLALVAVDRDYNSARDYNVQRARKIVTLKLIGYTEVAHTLFPRMGAGASAVLFGGLASERPYPGSTSTFTPASSRTHRLGPTRRKRSRTSRSAHPVAGSPRPKTSSAPSTSCSPTAASTASTSSSMAAGC
jgi:NADP-dependent 3-hydroxy acid dehydrogenase YdfG